MFEQVAAEEPELRNCVELEGVRKLQVHGVGRHLKGRGLRPVRAGHAELVAAPGHDGPHPDKRAHGHDDEHQGRPDDDDHPLEPKPKLPRHRVPLPLRTLRLLVAIVLHEPSQQPGEQHEREDAADGGHERGPAQPVRDRQFLVEGCALLVRHLQPFTNAVNLLLNLRLGQEVIADEVVDYDIPECPCQKKSQTDERQGVPLQEEGEALVEMQHALHAIERGDKAPHQHGKEKHPTNQCLIHGCSRRGMQSKAARSRRARRQIRRTS
mmetsp:Transcript_34999/g.88162  ORF Transcript_34999/g.88162 Transcript_34999/m.88162 type:complete len:267 (+) Transcript_34999:986-1786(+)